MVDEGMSEASDSGIVSKIFEGSVDDAVERLVQLVRDRGMTVCAIVDHSEEAHRLDLTLRDTTVVIFGSPVAGTPVMQAHPLTALGLPLKVLAWDDEGQTKISYLDPGVLALRHRLAPELTARLAGIGPLTDERVA